MTRNINPSPQLRPMDISCSIALEEHGIARTRPGSPIAPSSLSLPPANQTPSSEQTPFTLQLTSKHISSGPKTFKTTTFSCTMFVTITPSTTFLEFKEIFQRDALEHYFPNLQPKEEEEVVPEGAMHVRLEAVIPGKQRVEMKVSLKSACGKGKVKVTEENWESVVERVRAGEVLIVAWWVVFGEGC